METPTTGLYSDEGYEAARESSLIRHCTDLSRRTLNQIQTLVFFFGFNRCGSTAVGAVLDAHPHVLMANEWDFVGDMNSGVLIGAFFAGGS